VDRVVDVGLAQLGKASDGFEGERLRPAERGLARVAVGWSVVDGRRGSL